MAGNVLPDVFYDEAELIRRVYDPVSQQLDVGRFRFNLGHALAHHAEDDFVLQNGDQIVIRALRGAQVTVQIDGEVRFPGPYVFPGGATITDLIAAAGGLLPESDLRAAVFSRRSVQRLQQERLEKLVEMTRRRFEAVLEKMTKNGQPRESLAAKLSLDQTRKLLERLTAQQAVGRVVIPFLQDDFPNTPFNLTLESGDRLRIPRRQETVAVMGHVFNPSTFVVEKGLTVAEVLERSGGLTEYGDDRRSYVIRADGNIERLKGSQKSWKRTQLYAGDAVLVQRASLERALGAKLSDVLKLARQAGEAALLFDYLGGGLGSRDLTTVLPPQTDPGIAGYDEAILGN